MLSKAHDNHRPRTFLLCGSNLPIAELTEYVRGRDTIVITIKRGAASALEHLRELKYEVDLVITDMELAQGTGGSLTLAIREEEIAYGKHIEIIWATSIPHADPKHPISLAAAYCGVTRILPRPYDAVQILKEYE